MPVVFDSKLRIVFVIRTSMCSAQGERIFSKRKPTGEPVFGTSKAALYPGQFSRRGIAAVRGVWSLVCRAWNLKRMHRLINSA